MTAIRQREPTLANMAKQMDDFFVNELLYKRNELMADRIVKILKESPNESFFFAFGAGKL